MGLHFYRINNQEPPAIARPQHCTGVIYPRAGEDIRNLYGRPGGAQGWPWAVLSWDILSVEGYRWWANWIGEGFQSTTLNDVVLPDSRFGVTLSGRPYHSYFSRGVLHLIQESEDSERVILRGSIPYIQGAIKVLISELGRI